MNAAAQLTCSAFKGEDDYEIIDLMAEGGVPIVALSCNADQKQNTYSYWYAQISRNRPKAIDYVSDKYVSDREAPALHLQKTEAESSEGSTRIFRHSCTLSI